MIRAFWQSKATAAGVLLVTLLLTAGVWVRNQGYPVYIPLLASGLTLAIGLVLARLLANIAANYVNTKTMGYLHMDLDPEKFLAAYKGVPAKLDPKSKNHVLACAYLGDGYAAAGQFAQAQAALCPPQAGGYQDDTALMALYYNEVCAFALGAGQLKEAQAAADALQQVVNRARAEKPVLAEDMAKRVQLYRYQLAALRGSSVDRPWLEDQLRQAPFKLRRLEIAQVLAQAALARHDAADAARWLDLLEREGGKTRYPAWARAQRAALA